MISAVDISARPASEWDSFVRSQSDGTIFHMSEWLDVVAGSHGVKLVKVGFFRGSELIGVVPLFVRQYWPVRVAGSPLMVEDCPYMGLLIDRGLFSQALRALIGLCRRMNIHFVRIMQQGLYQLSEAIEGVKHVEKHTHVLDLTQTEEDLWSNLEGRCRTAVRKAVKSGVEVTREPGEQFPDNYYRMLENLYARQNMLVPNPKSLYRDMWDRYHGSAMHILFAWYEAKVIGGAILIHDGRYCYYLNGVSLEEYNGVNPNNLLQWEAVRYAKRLGASSYDFVGSDIDRLARFKKSFGGRLVTYTCLECSSSRLVTTLRNNYPRWKLFVGRIKKQWSGSGTN